MIGVLACLGSAIAAGKNPLRLPFVGADRWRKGETPGTGLSGRQQDRGKPLCPVWMIELIGELRDRFKAKKSAIARDIEMGGAKGPLGHKRQTIARLGPGYECASVPANKGPIDPVRVRNGS